MVTQNMAPSFHQQKSPPRWLGKIAIFQTGLEFFWKLWWPNLELESLRSDWQFQLITQIIENIPQTLNWKNEKDTPLLEISKQPNIFFFWD